jgi:hypothetical protein
MAHLTTFFALELTQLNNYWIAEAFFLSLNFNAFACGLGAGVDIVRERFGVKITLLKTKPRKCSVV